MTIPQSVSCIEIDGPGGPKVLKPAFRPISGPGPGEVLVQVAAAGVNRPDVLQRMGLYNPPPGTTDIPGLEIAGTVVETGEGVDAWAVGEDLCALVAGGGYAEYCIAPAPQCLPVPPGLSLVEAAALPETFFTVWTNVFERARLLAGETLLVHGGTSGIGTTAIQIASRLGCTVITTARTAAKCTACLELGASLAINYAEEDFVTAVKEYTGGRGVDVILDMVGGDYLPRNVQALARDGRLVNIAFLHGSKVELDFMPVMLKRLTLTGSTLRPQSIERKGEIAQALREQVWPMIAAGEIKPVIHATFPLAEAAEAHELMESGAHIGKIVLRTGL